jgi:hypothetical protein
MQETDIFLNLPQYNLNHYERDMLWQWQCSASYEEFKSDHYDGNLIAVNPEVPTWVFEKFTFPLSLSISYLFLKNKGLTSKHTDVYRECSLTVLLSNTHTSTDFYEEDNLVATLLHNGNTFLQNNQVSHFVEPSSDWRYFFQLSFDRPFTEIKEKLK